MINDGQRLHFAAIRQELLTRLADLDAAEAALSECKPDSFFLAEPAEDQTSFIRTTAPQLLAVMLVTKPFDMWSAHDLMVAAEVAVLGAKKLNAELEGAGL